MADQILYKDQGITLTNTYIQINKYYFPLATSKLIMFNEIEAVELNNTDGVSQRWGLCTKYLNNWFNLDPKRSEKKKFISIKLKNKNIRPSITPDEPDKVFQIIWQNHTPQGREFVEKMSSQVGKQTEINQQQIMDRMKQEKQGQQTTMNDLKMKK